MKAPPRWLGVFAVGYAAVAVLMFYASMGYGVLFLSGTGPRGVDGPLTRGGWEALATDLALMAAFGLQHSVMARDWFKTRVVRRVPPVFERATFVLLAAIFVGGMMAHWQPLPGLVWHVTGPAAGLVWALFLLAAGGEVAATFGVDHFELVGLRQAWCFATGKEFVAPPFTEAGLYRYVRHPMMTCLFPFLWLTPVMTVGHLLLASGLSVYIVIGTYLEERTLVRTFGDRYRDYQRRVPMFVPRLLPRRATTAPSA